MQPCITGKKQGKTTRKHRSAAGATCCTELPNRLSTPRKRNPPHSHTHTQGDHRRFCCFVQNTRPRGRFNVTTARQDSPNRGFLGTYDGGFYKNTVRWTAVTGEHTCTCSTMARACTACRSHFGRRNGQKEKGGGEQRCVDSSSHTHKQSGTQLCASTSY